MRDLRSANLKWKSVKILVFQPQNQWNPNLEPTRPWAYHRNPNFSPIIITEPENTQKNILERFWVSENTNFTENAMKMHWKCKITHNLTKRRPTNKTNIQIGYFCPFLLLREWTSSNIRWQLQVNRFHTQLPLERVRNGKQKCTKIALTTGSE